jgi:membrane fusion protein
VQVSGVLVPVEKPVRVDAAETLTVLDINLTTGASVEVGQVMLIAAPSVGNTDESRADEAAQDMRPLVIRAPRRGVVSAVNVVPGQRVAGNTNLAVIQPAGPLEAQADVPTQALGALQRGKVLQLRYRAFPYERFGRFAASVNWFRQVPADGTRPPATRDNSADAVTFRVGLRLAEQSPAIGGGKQLPLAAGMRFDTTIPLETRPVYRWLFNSSTNANG